MRILGIDPGLRLTGYGLVEVRTRAVEPTLVEGGVVRLNEKASVESRLAELYTELTGLMDRLKPSRVAVEKLYAHYAHPTTAILMGHARGVILLTAEQHGLPVDPMGATEVKKSLTGNGHASKQQVGAAVASQCGLAEAPSPADVSDAIAIALCAGRRLAFEKLAGP
ncbi:MAG: crossover junction endodeoxyribonuclease RuvC [Planctomycetota bacterium]